MPECKTCTHSTKRAAELIFHFRQEAGWKAYEDFVRNHYLPAHGQDSRAYDAAVSYLLKIKRFEQSKLSYLFGRDARVERPELITLADARWAQPFEIKSEALISDPVFFNPFAQTPQYPKRHDRTLEVFRQVSEDFIEVREPATAAEIDAVHGKWYNRSLETLAMSDDVFLPMAPDIKRAAAIDVKVSLEAAKHLEKEDLCFALTQTGGHHASSAPGSLCYYNTAALAANELSDGKVAILDIDAHFGNGTEALVAGRKNIHYISLHEMPNVSPISEPSLGGFTARTENCKYYALPLCASWRTYESAMKGAVKDIKNLRPDYLLVSAGVDGYYEDPLGFLALDKKAYLMIGQKIKSLVKSLKIPSLILTEGGYSEETGNLFHLLAKGLTS